MAPRHVLFVGPKGAGKGMLVEAALHEFPQLQKMIAHTTRPPRANEVNGYSYHFVDEDAFRMLFMCGKLLWHFSLGQSRYGICKSETRRFPSVMDVYPDGARTIRRIAKEQGGRVLLIGVFAERPVRWDRIKARQPDLTLEELKAVLNADPVSGEKSDYNDFDLLIDNNAEESLDLAREKALEAIRRFLTGSEP